MATENSRNGDELVVGSLVSLISRNRIRYEGILYFLNAQESTLGLKNVRSYRTEGRWENGPQPPPGYQTYEICQFSRNDIEELQVMSVPPTQPTEQVYGSSTNIQDAQNTGADASSSSSSVTVEGQMQSLSLDPPPN